MYCGKYNLFWDDIINILQHLKETLNDEINSDFELNCFIYLVHKYYFENANSFSFNFNFNFDKSLLNITLLRRILDSIFTDVNKTEILVLKLGKSEELPLSSILFENIKRSNTLNELYLSSILENESFLNLIEAFGYSNNIKKLEIQIKGNGITTLNQLIKSLSINKSIQELRISLKITDFDNYKILENLILSSNSLKTICISKCNLSEQSMFCFVSAINMNKVLRKFMLNSTISVGFILKFFSGLKANHMEEVSLNSDSYLSTYQLNDFFNSFFKLKSKKNYIELGEDLIINHHYFENYTKYTKTIPSLYDKSSINLRFSNKIPHLQYLTNVSLFKNLVKNLVLHDILLQDSDIMILSMFVEKSVILTNLTLSYIRLSDKFNLLEKSLSKNESILSLSFIYNEFLGIDIEKISSYISKSTIIQEFSLSYANLGKISSTELATSLKLNNSLRVLRLSRLQSKNFSHFVTLFKGINQSNSIEELHFYYNQTVFKKESLLANIMKGNKTIRFIDFGSLMFLFNNSIFDDNLGIVRM